jgi:hypothetical protein
MAVQIAAAPVPELHFDGSAVDLDRIMAHCSVSFLLEPQKFPTDQTKSAFLAKHFRGGALDWLAVQLREHVDDSPDSPLANFPRFVANVKASFGLDGSAAINALELRLASITQGQNDLLAFLAEAEGLLTRLGINSDASRLTIMLGKLAPVYREALARSTVSIGTYAGMTKALKAMYALGVGPQALVRADGPSRRRRGRCGKCGKRGHTATECQAKN